MRTLLDEDIPRSLRSQLIDELGKQVEELEHQYEQALERGDRQLGTELQESILMLHRERRRLMIAGMSHE
jgi:hypothetical protein